MLNPPKLYEVATEMTGLDFLTIHDGMLGPEQYVTLDDFNKVTDCCGHFQLHFHTSLRCLLLQKNVIR